MPKLFFLSLLLILLALFVTVYLGFPADPGYLLIAFGDYSFETSLFALFVAAAVIYLLFRLIMIVLRWLNPLRWAHIGKRLAGRRVALNRSRSVEGLLYLAHQNWQSAYNLLTRSSKDEDASVINYLGAAYAAYHLDERENWNARLNEAEEEYPEARSTINFLRARLLFGSGQVEQSLALLERLRKTALNDEPLLRHLKQAYREVGDWSKLQALIPTLESGNVISDEEIALVEKQVLLQRLEELASQAGGERSTEQVLAEMRKVWKKADSQYKADTLVVIAYVRLLMQLEAREAAAKVLERALEREWSQTLIVLYGREDYGISEQQLLKAEKWLQSRPNDADLTLCLGRLAMRQRSWDMARQYFEASLKAAPSAEAYGELGRLLWALGEEEASARNLQRYGEHLGANLPPLPLPERTAETPDPAQEASA